MWARLLPIFIAVGYGFLAWRFSLWRMSRQLAAQSCPLDDPQIAVLTDKMAVALGIPRVKVLAYDVDAVNGLALADGRIFLTQGFLRRKAQGDFSAAELAAVIAHELGHVALGHARRRMIAFSGQNAAFVVLSALLARFLPYVGPWLARLVTSAFMARLSRHDEFEADAYAAALLVKSGIGAAPLISLFEKLDGAGGSDMPQWFLSHPKPQARIAAIKAHPALWQGGLGAGA